MNTFDFELNGVRVTLVGNSGDEISQVLRDNDLAPLLHNHFYYSKTTEQRTGEGWIRLADMNENFIVNSFVARLGESIKGMYKTAQQDTSGLALTLFNSFLLDLVHTLEHTDYLYDQHDNLPVLNGLVAELTRRDMEESLNNEFDDDTEDVASSDSGGLLYDQNNGNTVEPRFIRLSGTGNLSALDRA